MEELFPCLVGASIYFTDDIGVRIDPQCLPKFIQCRPQGVVIKIQRTPLDILDICKLSVVAFLYV